MLEDHVPTVEEAISVLAGTAPARVYAEGYLDLFDADHTSGYWVSRVGLDIAAANRCGTDLHGRPTYPVRDSDGRLLGVVTRHDDDPKQKYHYPFGVSTSRTVWGDLRPAHVLVLVEGAADVMALQQTGLPPSWCALGVFGAGLHFPQLELVHRTNAKVVVAAFDNDTAGRTASARARHLLEPLGYTVVSDPWSSIGVKDAGECPRPKRISTIIAAMTNAGVSHY
jgi:hypothetical protein